MKYQIIPLLLFMVSNSVAAQNVGIGTTEPLNKLQVQGSLLVAAPTKATNTPPTAAQTKTMPGLGTLAFMLNTDSTGRLYDYGGPAGNYGIDHDGKATIASSSNIALELTVETMDLNIGDSLIIKTSSTGTVLLAVGNVYNSTGKWIFNSSSLYINFKSNTDFNIGAGFSLLFKRLYDNSATLPQMNGLVSNNNLFFDAKSGAFRSGRMRNSERGDYSAALGDAAVASGAFSFAAGYRPFAGGDGSIAMGLGSFASSSGSVALGEGTSASGAGAVALGYETLASGPYAASLGKFTKATGYAASALGDSSQASGIASFASGIRATASNYASVAMGNNTTASGHSSIALGIVATASGYASTAMGINTSASGDYSTALGAYVSTNFKEGSFVIGDASTPVVMNSLSPNNFRARFAGGYRFYTSADYTSNCLLAAGANAWSTSSDVRTKENFADVDGEDFLKKIAAMQLTSWNYKTQNSKTFRHYGPMAQDFFAAFGTDKYGTIGNDTTINSADFAGVSFIAIQALEKRTQQIDEIKIENQKLKKDNASLNEMFWQMRKEIEALKLQIKKIEK